MTKQEVEMKNKIKDLTLMEKNYFMMFYVAIKECEILDKKQDIFQACLKKHLRFKAQSDTLFSSFNERESNEPKFRKSY